MAMRKIELVLENGQKVRAMVRQRDYNKLMAKIVVSKLTFWQRIKLAAAGVI